MVKIFIFNEQENSMNRILAISPNYSLQMLLKKHNCNKCGGYIYKTNSNFDLLLEELKELNVEIVFDDRENLDKIKERMALEENTQLKINDYHSQLKGYSEMKFPPNILEYSEPHLNGYYHIKLPINKYMFANLAELKKLEITKNSWVMNQYQFKQLKDLCALKKFEMVKI